MKMSMEQWLNDTEREKSKCSEKNLSQRHFDHHKFLSSYPTANSLQGTNSWSL